MAVSSANDLYSKGNAHFVEENYQAAVEYYGQAIELDDTCSEYYSNRAHAYLKLGQYKECKADIDSALELGMKNGKLFFRKGIACYHLEQFDKAKDAFVASHDYEDADKSLSEWVSKCEAKLKNKASSSQDKIAPVPVPPAKIRYDWYQTEPDVLVAVLLKNAVKENVEVQFTEKTMTCRVVRDTDLGDYNLELRLSHTIVPSQCSTKVLPSKIEIKLRKAEGIQWSTLEASGNDENVKQFAPDPTSNATSTCLAYPSSSAKKKDWDKIVVDLKKDEESENVEGEAAVNHLFQKIYADGSDEVKRAMNKSFTESGGTVLSTNWKDIGKKKVDVKPPDGMEWKKWEV